MTDHKVVSRAEGQAARDELLRREKEHTRAGDELARLRRELPWVAISKEYGLDGLLPHLHARDVTLLLVSRAPLAKLQAYRERMGCVRTWIRHDEYA